MPDLVGTNLGQYSLLSLLGKGGMAEVYLAYDEVQDREVAVKVVGSGNADYLERFWREVAAVDKLAHDHILPAYDYDSEGSWHYMVMLYAPYGTLRDRLLKGPLTPEEAAEILEQVADALQFAHDNGIIHRDIKPSNILLYDEYYAYLGDFGLAKSLDGSANTITQTGALLGTPEYMAPDLADGPATISSDLYALGIVLYEMITGRVPFNAPTPVAVYWKHLRDTPLPPSQINPALSPAIDSVVLRALEKEPNKRYTSARALAEAFNHALENPEAYLAYEVERAFDALEREKVPVSRLSPGPPVVQTEHAYTAQQRAITPEELVGLSSEATAQVSHLPETPHSVSRPARKQRRRTSRRTSLIVGIIVPGLLLFIVLPMTYIYYIFSTMGNTSSSRGTVGRGTATPQVAATASPDLPATIAASTPILNDSLIISTPGRWAEEQGRCGFLNGSYRSIVRQENHLQPCPLLAQFVEDMAVQVDVSLLSGNNAGILLRLQGERFYDFEITSQGQFFFRRHDNGGGTRYVELMPPTASKAILPVNQQNTLLVIAKGSLFRLYINGTFVAEVRDSTYSGGQVALAAGTLSSQARGEGSFANFKLFNERHAGSPIPF
jgi:serine/threonine protein kinase